MAGAYLALLGMFGLGLGVILRHTAGAITTFVGIIFLLPVLLQPLNAQGNPGRFTPEQILANSVASVAREPGQISPGLGFALMCLYCAVTLGVAMLVLHRRDA
jgi:hypothetical protein